MTRRAHAAPWLGALFAACAVQGPAPLHLGDARLHGEHLYDGMAHASPSKLNLYACKSCHVARAADAASRVLPGAPLAGVVQRPAWWGGSETELLRAVNQCRTQFMHAPTAWRAEDVEARALWAWLVALPADVTQAWPFGVVPVAADLPKGDAQQGGVVYLAACRSCHGAAQTGVGKLAARIPTLPGAVVQAHQRGYTKVQRRVVFVEKVRHGGFLGYGGDMPPFSREVLPDADLAALLAWFGLYE
ncbi:MAG: hypothetical protein EXR79_02630 [Myxococcales bacterium]|nr:hypothetical protein [Myxococcales bacterium]